MGVDMISSLTLQGCKVDYLTRFDSLDEQVIGLVKEPYNYHERISNLLKRSKFVTILGRKILRLMGKNNMPKDNYIRGNGTAIVNPDETNPAYDVKLVLSKIENKYDFVVIFVWQDMLTAVTIKAIFDHLKVPIFLVSPDMQTFTGGCYYFGECRNFSSECGRCPIIGSNDSNDLTHKNFLVKKRIYSEIKVAFLGNTHVNRFAKMSKLFPDNRIFYCPSPFNESDYKPLDVGACKCFFHIPNDKQFVIFSRFAGLEQKVKGYEYLLDAVNRFAQMVAVEDRKKILLVFAGVEDIDYQKRFLVDVKNVGLLKRDELIKMYSASSVFVSSSIDDAGPSMVYQSMMCGTPVVSFDIGAAIDLVENGVTGYKAKMKDSEDFAKGLKMLFEFDQEHNAKVRHNCRIKATEHCSLDAFGRRMINIYNECV